MSKQRNDSPTSHPISVHDPGIWSVSRLPAVNPVRRVEAATHLLNLHYPPPRRVPPPPPSSLLIFAHSPFQISRWFLQQKVHAHASHSSNVLSSGQAARHWLELTRHSGPRTPCYGRRRLVGVP